jgi:hypothetical protein
MKINVFRKASKRRYAVLAGLMLAATMIVAADRPQNVYQELEVLLDQLSAGGYTYQVFEAQRADKECLLILSWAPLGKETGFKVSEHRTQKGEDLILISIPPTFTKPPHGTRGVTQATESPVP